MRAGFMTGLLCVGILSGAGGHAFAQGVTVDLAGEWGLRMHEDQPWRGPGQRVGEYQGLPINAEARMKAQSWMASAYAMPERQCIPFPVDMAYTFGNMRIWKIKDSASQETVAWGQLNEWQQQERTIWMDGRPHPPEGAPHTWQGFSTGEWVGNILRVRTTHLKYAYLERNGVPRSDRATVEEFYMQRGNVLTIMTIVTDPVYLDEPWVRTRNFQATPNQELNAYPCRPAVEVDVTPHSVPHYLPGTNPFIGEVIRGLPASAAPGGARTMYPEFSRQLTAQP